MPSWSYPNQHMPQPQFYETNWNNHYHSSPSEWGSNTPESYCQPPFQPFSSYTSFTTPPMFQSSNDPFDGLEEKVDHLQGLMNEQISRLSNILELTNQVDRNQE